MKLKFYPFILTAILAVVNIFLFYRVINFDAKYEVLDSTLHKVLENKKLTDSETELQKFKEESYIRHQERDTNLILFVFTLFAGVTAFITIRSFTVKIAEHAAVLDKKYEDHAADNKKHHERLLKLESNVNFEVSYLKKNLATESLSRGDFEYYTFYTLVSCVHMGQCIAHHLKDGYSDQFVKTLLSGIILDLTTLNQSIVSVNMVDTSKETVKYMIRKINVINNVEVYDLLTLIYLKLLFATVEKN